VFASALLLILLWAKMSKLSGKCLTDQAYLSEEDGCDGFCLKDVLDSEWIAEVRLKACL
jgi:hypothetical protein